MPEAAHVSVVSVSSTRRIFHRMGQSVQRLTAQKHAVSYVQINHFQIILV